MLSVRCQYGYRSRCLTAIGGATDSHLARGRVLVLDEKLASKSKYPMRLQNNETGKMMDIRSGNEIVITVSLLKR